jgi:hypothetical protein
MKKENRMSDNNDISTTSVAETANFIVWSAKESDGEETHHIELGLATIHFFKEEWEEFLELFKDLV